MDIVLEVTDTFLADGFYAWALPSQKFSFDHHNEFANNTSQWISSWQYEPSTHFFYLEPTDAAYESVWARDNIWRQALTLFTLGW